MNAPAPADPGLEQVWRPLERRLRLKDGFGLFVVLVRDAALVPALKSKVVDWLNERSAFADISIREASGFAAAALQDTLSAVAHEGVRLCWLEAHRGAGVAAWDQERGELLSRLNERRSWLETALKGGLILLLPENSLRLAASAAPDLWHVRSLTVTLATALASPKYQVSAAELQLCMVASHRLAFGDALVVYAYPWMDRWQAIFGDRMLSADQLSDSRIFDLPISDGARAVQAALGAGQLKVASAVAEKLVQLTALRRETVVPGAFTIGITHDECLAFLARGDALTAKAQASLGLEDYLRAELAARSHAEQQRTHAVGAALLEAALDPLWFAAARLKEWAHAERALMDVALLRQHNSFGWTDEAARRVVSAALVGWGHVKAMQGDVPAAESSLEQALSLLAGASRQPWSVPADASVASLAMVALARLRLQQGDPAAAAELLHTVLGMARAEPCGRPDSAVLVRTHALHGPDSSAVPDQDALQCLSQWAALLPSAVDLLREQGDRAAAEEGARLAVQLSSRYVEGAQRSSRSLWLHWRSLATAKTVSSNPELDSQMDSLTMEWSARFPELPATPDQADLLSSGIPVPGAQAARVTPSPTAPSAK